MYLPSLSPSSPPPLFLFLPLHPTPPSPSLLSSFPPQESDEPQFSHNVSLETKPYVNSHPPTTPLSASNLLPPPPPPPSSSNVCQPSPSSNLVSHTPLQTPPSLLATPSLQTPPSSDGSLTTCTSDELPVPISRPVPVPQATPTSLPESTSGGKKRRAGQCASRQRKKRSLNTSVSYNSTCTCTCTCMCIQSCTCTRPNMYIHVHVHVHMYIPVND